MEYSKIDSEDKKETLLLKKFNVELIHNNQTVISKLEVDFQSFIFLFRTDTKKSIEIIIPFNEIIGYSEVNNMKRFKNANLENKRVIKLNYFHQHSVRSCNCLGIFCCKCRVTSKERILKKMCVVIHINIFEEVIYNINKVNFGEKLSRDLENKIRRKFLFFLNPIGGQGKSTQIWESIRPLLKSSTIEVVLFHTQHRNHAYEHTFQLDSNEYQGIVCVSGDGILHEVINAIFHRREEDLSFDIPVGTIPAGSGNGMAHVIAIESGETKSSPELLTYILCKGQYREFDILELETLSRKKIYSFLSFTWGMIADIDIESEKIRCCGATRFTLFGIWRVLCLRLYYGTLYYQTGSDKGKSENLPPLTEELPDSFTRVNGNTVLIHVDTFSYFMLGNVEYISQNMRTLPKAKIDDGFGENSGRIKTAKQLLNMDEGDYFDNNGNLREGTGLEYKKITAFRLYPKANLNDQEDYTNIPRFPTVYSIDGESFPIEPIQGRILNKSIKMFCLNNNFNNLI